MNIVEAIKTLKTYCERTECEGCQFFRGKGGICGILAHPPCFWNEEKVIEVNAYDEEERHENCTVQILRNSATGEESIGWWENHE